MVKGLIVYMILFYVISFAAFIGYSYFTFSASSFLPIYRSITIFNKAFQLFLLYLPAAQFSAVLMAASFSQGASAMARYEHLPIYKKAMDLTVYFEKIMRDADDAYHNGEWQL